MNSTEVKKKILLTIPRMPFPLNAGGRIAIYDTVRLLSKHYKLVIVIIDDKRENIKYIDEIKKFSDEVYFFSKNPLRFYLNALFGLLKGKPLQVGYFYFKEVQELVNSLSISCDFFYAFMIRTTNYGLNLQMKKGHYAIDSMYLNYKKSEEKTTSILWKFIYKIEIPLLFKTELKHIKKYNLTTFVNREEALFWKNYGDVETLPHGVDDCVLNYSKIDKQYNNVVAFIGRMDYQPNIDAVLWFCKNVLPLLKSDIQFYIIGGFPTPEILKLKDQYCNVNVLGFVNDPYVILRSCICTVAPMQSGGGLQTKILMAMAVESIVLSTSLSTNAIENCENRENMIIEDNALNFAEIINDIYLSPNDYTKIRKSARNLILRFYSLEVIESKLFNLINKYLN